jgi:hypothetical protein
VRDARKSGEPYALETGYFMRLEVLRARSVDDFAEDDLSTLGVTLAGKPEEGDGPKFFRCAPMT